jgi:hypothetical protein
MTKVHVTIIKKKKTIKKTKKMLEQGWLIGHPTHGHGLGGGRNQPKMARDGLTTLHLFIFSYLE